MRIKMEIDMKPEELQRFLGLPDVGAVREEVMQFIRERVAADPAGFVLDNLDQLRKSPTVRRILYGRQAEPEGRHAPRRDDEESES